LEQRLAGWRACVNALPIEVQINPGAVELAEEGNEILQAAAETIDVASSWQRPDGGAGAL
jgi:hypothetical protein